MPEGGWVAKGIDADGPKEVAYSARRRFSVGHGAPKGGPAQHSTQNVNQHGQPVAFVSTMELSRATEGHDASAHTMKHVLQDPMRVRGRAAALVYSPAQWQRFVEPIVDLDLAPGDDRGRHVENKGGLSVGGSGKGDRVRAEHHLATERGDTEGGSIGHGDADHVVLDGHHCIVAGDAKVVRVAHAAKRSAGRNGLANHSTHRSCTDRRTHRAVGVQHDRGGCVGEHLDRCIWHHHAGQ